MRRSNCLVLFIVCACLIAGCEPHGSVNDKGHRRTLQDLYEECNGKGVEEYIPDVTPIPAPTVTPVPSVTPAPHTTSSGRISIDDIADVDWARQHAPSFPVSTPEEFAGTVLYLNSNQCEGIDIYIMNDIDLDDYDWRPLDDFAGIINGQGHTISNIHLVDPSGNHNGIIGCNGGAIGIHDLRVENAEVRGGGFAGIFIGEGYLINLDNVYASGTVESDGEFVGALVGRTSPSTTYDTCSMDVTLNGYAAEFFSYTQENEAHADLFAEEIYTLTMAEDHTVTRSEEDYDAWNLGWRVIYNGEIVLDRNAEDELEYRYYIQDPGEYEIYLVEYSSRYSGYVRVSNIIEYTIP